MDHGIPSHESSSPARMNGHRLANILLSGRNFLFRYFLIDEYFMASLSNPNSKYGRGKHKRAQ